MKNIQIYTLLSILIFSCSFENSEDKVPNADNSTYIWLVEQITDNEKQMWNITRGKILINSQEPLKIIDALNNTYNAYYPEIKLEHLSNDTLYIKLYNEEKYSNEMGSNGSQQFLAQLIFTLTESDDIDFVNLDIEIGEHGKPGVYSRFSFSGDGDYRILE